MTEGLEGKPKRRYFYTKAVKRKKKQAANKRKANEKYRKRRKDSHKAMSAEKRVHHKEAVDGWVVKRTQYNLFMQDVLTPRADIEWTTLAKIDTAYHMYCQAIGQVPECSRKALSALLRENFCWKQALSGIHFGLVLKDVFVRAQDEVKVNG